VTVCTFFLLLAFLGQPAFAQSSSDQTQSLTNDQTFNTSGGTQSNYFEGGRALRGFPFPRNNPLPPFLQTPPHFAPPVTDGNYGAL
jgi:hypothetical protein